MRVARVVATEILIEINVQFVFVPGHPFLLPRVRLESRATPTIDDLSAPDYELLGEFTHASLPAFLVEFFLRRPSWLTRLHHAISLSIVVTAIAVGYARGISIVAGLRDFVVAFVALFLVILPLHEIIHAVAYRMIGARDIRWDYSMRFLAVWVIAHRFVAGTRPFVFVALAPYVLLNAAIIVAAVVWPSLAVFFLCLLLWHHQGASGDLALLNFVWLHRVNDFWTFDDAAAGKSYFYGRRSYDGSRGHA